MKSVTLPDLSNLKIALVCDWLTEVGGAEKVLLAIHEMFPNAPIYTSQFRAKSAPSEFTGADVRIGWLNIFPRALRKFISPLRYFYFSHLNLNNYDLVISVCNAEAKNIKTGTAMHIAYLQGPPTQYYWGQYDEYIKNPGFGKLNFLARWGLKILVKPLRRTDFKAAQKPNYLLANSTYVADEIKKYYQRDATVLHPNVDTETIVKLVTGVSKKSCTTLRKELFNDEGFFIIAGRQTNWKRVDLAIEACIRLDANLLVAGYGAEHQKLVDLAGQNPRIKFLPCYDGTREIVPYFTIAQTFIFPSFEPFGITPVEALAAGVPVVALARGGALDFVSEGKNGLFFKEQNVDNLMTALQKVSKMKFSGRTIQSSAQKFSKSNFKRNLNNILVQKLAARHDR